MIYDYTFDELNDELLSRGHKSYRTKQVFEWLYKKQASTTLEMTNLPKDLKDDIEALGLVRFPIVHKQISMDGTIKYLFELEDKNTIEAVLMRYDWGNSLCITTQVGCNIGCSFCASGLNGKVRDLTLGEVTLQVLQVSEDEAVRISNIVVMGIGEPFDNYDVTMRAMNVLNDHRAFEIGARHITISTSGLVPKIYDFALEPLQINLAISLHAPNDALRSKIMKINKSYPIKEVIKAAKAYVNRTNRRITFEYILLKGVNDSAEIANELSDLIRGINCYVNLIPFNPVAEFDYDRTPKNDALVFYDVLKKRGINATLRQEKGTDILAACGQLRQNNL